MDKEELFRKTERLKEITDLLVEDDEAPLEDLYEEVVSLLKELPDVEGLLPHLSDEEIEVLRRTFLFRKGALNQLLRFISLLPEEMKSLVGATINDVKKRVVPPLKRKKGSPPLQYRFDVTAPGKVPEVGRRHIITLVTERICDVMRQLGFTYAEGPEVEDEFHNFIALNIPENHPARDESDNFYITDKSLLRSQTSPVQIRYMEKHAPPIRIFAPGRVYRPDTVDASHYYAFHQVEGLWVDRGISFAHLKTTLLLFSRLMLGENVRVRLRPSFFPFTEPSAEIDFSCFVCGGDGCPTCSKKGWLEMGGCGMVNPKVLRFCDIDPEIYTGFAFGIGIDRIAMLRYGINDIRLLFQNDIRFLEQF